MDKQFFNEIKQIIESFNQSLSVHLPALKNEVNGIIERNSKDSNEIEYCFTP